MAQPINLVPNGSFEDTIDYKNGFFAPKFWDLNLGTADYFNKNFSGSLDIRKTPLNYYGYQVPKNGGEAYVGISVINKSLTNTREYIQVELIEPLEKDSTYIVSFWVSLPDSFHWACSETNLGFAFSDTMVKSNFEVLDRLPSKYFSDLSWDPTDKIEWQKIETKVQAKGNESYLIIGNFYRDDLTPIIDVGGGDKPVYHRLSYYYIDKINISVHRDMNFFKKIVIPNVFTPNGDGVNDVWWLSNSEMVNKISIYNRWGGLVKEIEGAEFIWVGNNSPSGVYFYKILYTEEQIEKVKTGIITLIR